MNAIIIYTDTDCHQAESLPVPSVDLEIYPLTPERQRELFDLLLASWGLPGSSE
jgi:hypothetical protein